jgi:hypothetical protein
LNNNNNDTYLIESETKGQVVMISGSTGGNLSVYGNTTLAGTLSVSGNTTISGSCSSSLFITTSDYRIKENVKNLDEKFSIDELRPVIYYNKNIKRQDMGFIAHEVQEIFHFLVHGEKDDSQLQSLNYNGFIALLVKEIQELKKEIQELKKK